MLGSKFTGDFKLRNFEQLQLVVQWWWHRLPGGQPHDLDNLLSIASNMEGRTICVFADAAAWPVQSYIGKFREEFEFHIRERRCDLEGGAAAGMAHAVEAPAA